MTKRQQRTLLTTLFIMVCTMASTAQAVDTRKAVWLTADEREVVLIEMRNFLRGSQQVLEHSLNEDMKMVERTAKPLGLKMLKNLPKELKEDMPPSFFAMFKTLHYGFAEIADISKSPTANSKVVLQKLANMQKLCVSCHATYQLKVKK
jgi:hypothetical protein